MPRTKGVKESKKNSKSGSKTVTQAGNKNTIFKDEYVDVIEQHCRTGKTIEQLAKLMGIGATTIRRWRDKRSAVADAIKKGQYAFDTGRIQKTMVEKALGIEFDETTEEYIEIDGEYYIEVTSTEEMGERDGKKVFQQVKKLIQGIKRKIVHKMIPPSDVLMMFWLQNRLPEEWKNVQRQLVEQKTTVEHTHTYDLSKLGREELERLKSLVEKAKADEASANRGSGLCLSAG